VNGIWTGSAADWGSAVEGVTDVARQGYLRELAEELLCGPRGSNLLDAGQALPLDLAILLLDRANATRCYPPLVAREVRSIAADVAAQIAREAA
jgi:hypothetical protein